MTKRLWIVLGLALCLAVTASPALAWDTKLVQFMNLDRATRLAIIVGGLDMFYLWNNVATIEKMERDCTNVTRGNVLDTIEQWYRTGRLDPTDTVANATYQALHALCPYVHPQPRKPSSNLKPGA